jgi:hypothetical protein
MTKPNPNLVKAVANIQRHGLVSPITGEKDSVVVQMNPRQARALPQLLGETPSINPATGALSFAFGGGHGPSGNAGSHSGGGGGNSTGGGGGGGTGTTAGGGSQHSPEGGFGGGERGSPAGPSGTGPAGGGPSMSSGALRDMSPQTSPNVSISRTATGISPDQAARDERSQMDNPNRGEISGSYGPTSLGQRALKAANIGLNALGVNFSPNITGVSTVNPDGTVSTVGTMDRVSVDPAKAALGLASLAPGPLGMAATLGGLAYSGAKNLGLTDGVHNVGISIDHDGGIGDPDSGRSTGTQGAGHTGNNGGGGQTTHDLAAALTANTPTSVGTGATPAGLPALYAPPPNVFQGQAVPLNTFSGTPWPTYPANIWAGGGSGSRPF